jgi:hypothetical protein
MIRPKAIAVLQHITKEVQDERLAKVVCRAWLTFLRAVDDTVLMQILSQVSLRGFAACVLCSVLLSRLSIADAHYFDSVTMWLVEKKPSWSFSVFTAHESFETPSMACALPDLSLSRPVRRRWSSLSSR